MARRKRPTNYDLQRRIVRFIRDLLELEIQWQHAFGTTYRENEEVVVGSLRDTVDTADLWYSVSAKVREGGVTIAFDDKGAEFIFGEKGRHEFWDYAVTKLVQQIGVYVAEYEIYKRLGRSAKGLKGSIKIGDVVE